MTPFAASSPQPHSHRVRSAHLMAGMLLLLVVGFAAAPFAAFADRTATVTLLDQAGERAPGEVRVEVLAVDIRAETIQVRQGTGERRELPFARIDPDSLYSVLLDEVERLEQAAIRNRSREAQEILGYAHLVIARLCLSRDQLGSAEQHLQRAEQHDPQVAEAVARERRLLAELSADNHLRQAHEHMADGDLGRARTVLERLQRRYPDTAAGRAVPAVVERLAQLEQAQERETDGRPRTRTRPSSRPDDDPLRTVRDAIEQAEALRQQGHELLGRDGGPDQRFERIWHSALEVLEGRNGVLARLQRAVDADTAARLDEAEVATLRVRIREVRMHLYKALIHQSLAIGRLSPTGALLDRAFSIDPQDRELLHLSVLYHSAVRWEAGRQDFDRPEPNPPVDPTDPAPREPDPDEPESGSGANDEQG